MTERQILAAAMKYYQCQGENRGWRRLTEKAKKIRIDRMRAALEAALKEGA